MPTFRIRHNKAVGQPDLVWCHVFSYDAADKDSIWLELFIAFGKAVSENEEYVLLGNELLDYFLTETFEENFNVETFKIYTIEEWLGR